MKNEEHKFPSPSELERDFNEFLTHKYGGSVRVGSIFPMPKGDDMTEEGPEVKPEPASINFNLRPEELEAYLDKYVIKQKEAKEILATKICTHFHKIKLSQDNEAVGNIKNNIILIGPTGVGKTYLVKLIANKIGVPFVKGDATKYSETGYVGGDVEQLVRDLVQEADGNLGLAQYGIIYLDEIDKIASSGGSYGPDVSRTGVQRNLLKLMEETDVDLKVPHDLASQLEAAMKFQKTGKMERKKINTRNILFIVSGAFGGLDDIIMRRLNVQGIGFTGGVSQSVRDEQVNYLKQVKSEDLISYGFESEFIGRLPVVAILDELQVEDLYQILSSPNCAVILNKKRDFAAYGIEVLFEEEALLEIARRAYKEKTGARGLVSALEKVLIKFEKRLPSTDIKRFVVLKEIVENPDAELKKLLENPQSHRQIEAYERLVQAERNYQFRQIREHLQQLQSKRNTKLDISGTLMELMVNQVLAKKSDVEKICDLVLNEYQSIHQVERHFTELYGLRIHFSAEAADLLIQRALEQNETVENVCHRILKNYQHGLRLIKDNKVTEFEITRYGVIDPEGYLNQVIKDYFQKHPFAANP